MTKQELVQQEQVEQVLSFEDICPNISALISKEGGYMNMRDNRYVSEDGNVKTMQQSLNCALGEAHGN